MLCPSSRNILSNLSVFSRHKLNGKTVEMFLTGAKSNKIHCGPCFVLIRSHLRETDDHPIIFFEKTLNSCYIALLMKKTRIRIIKLSHILYSGYLVKIYRFGAIFCVSSYWLFFWSKGKYFLIIPLAPTGEWEALDNNVCMI